MIRVFNRLAIAATLSATLLMALAADAAAQISVTARAALHEGFGRVVFDWPKAPDYQSTRDGRRLRVTFKEPFTSSFDSCASTRQVAPQIVQSALQPSPSILLPSSHSSPPHWKLGLI